MSEIPGVGPDQQVARRHRALAVPIDAHEPRYVEHDRSHDLSVGTYAIAAGGVDGQSPHTEDEVYVVVSGSATLWTLGTVLPAEPGDILFVPAGVEHRFVDVGPDFRAVVAFGPAEFARAR